MVYKLLITAISFGVFMTNIASAVVYENANNGTGQWYVYDNDPTGASVTATYDQSQQSNVIQLTGSDTDNGYMIGSFDDTLSWNNTNDHILSWDMKVNENFVIYLRVNTVNGYRYLYYTAHDVSYGKAEGSSYIHFGLGSGVSNGIWQTLTRDLSLDVKAFEPDNELLAVHAFLIRGSMSLDNIELTGGVDNTRPVITLNGDAFVNIVQNSDYRDAGAVAIDDVDGNITANIVSVNSVDTTTPGTYVIRYNVSDASGNQAIEVTRTVSVIPAPTNSNKVLLLYDDAGAYGHMGVTNAIFLENLLGHFGEITVTTKPASQYIANEMSDARAVFYLGTTYDALSNYDEGSAEKEAYHNFYRDIATLGRNIIWINYNLNTLENFWQSQNLNNTTFAQQFGISFNTISQGQYNRVTYKNTELFKGVIPYATPGAGVSLCADEGNNRYACALELNQINIVDATKTETFATTYSTLNAATAETPYITKASNFWFVGDIPFTYMSEEDRYLAFSDVLHDMLEIPHAESHKAIMRLEDVDARTDLTAFNSIATYMQSKSIPFSVATIAIYEDPLGIENNGVATTELLTTSAMGARLKELYDAGAIHIIQHGTTHQYHENITDPEADIKNPYNGLSGDDFEFMRVVETDPNLPYSYLYPTMSDSRALARERTIQGKEVLTDLGVTAFAWEAPHYMAGPEHYRGISEVYPVQYSRMLYYPFENDLDTSKKYEFIGQFFPFMIQKDVYGCTIIPENIHNIEDAPNAGYRPLMPSDTIQFSKKLKVVRDGVASFFYHPYLGSTYLSQMVEGLEAEGYQFVSGPSLVQ